MSGIHWLNISESLELLRTNQAANVVATYMLSVGFALGLINGIVIMLHRRISK